MKKLKVAMLSTMYLRFSTDTRGLMVSEFNERLLENDMEVHVVAPNDNYKGYEKMKGIHVYRFSYFFPFSLQRLAYGSGIPTNLRKSMWAKIQVPFFAASFLLKTIKVARKCDLIHCQWIYSGVVGVFAKWILRKPLVVTVRRVAKGNLNKKVSNFVLKNTDFVVFNSSYTMKEGVKIRKLSNYATMRNTIDIQKFQPSKKGVLALRKKLNIEKDAPILFALGLLVEKKGFSYLIQAMPAILRKHPKAVLLIGGEGSEREKLERLIGKYGLEGKVRLLGTLLSDVTPTYFNLADIFVLPSIIDHKGETETLGVVLLEALACGTPVVATHVGGIPDIVTPKVGELLPQKNVKAIEKSLAGLLSDTSRREKLGKQGRIHVEKNFSGDVIPEIIKKYKTLVTQNKK